MELIIDIECTYSIVEKVAKTPKGYVKRNVSDKGDPFNDDNYIVCAGYYDVEHGYSYCDFSSSVDVDRLRQRVREASSIVGHNIKFDMHHLRRCGFDFSHCKIIDTMVDEYLLSGGTDIFSGLDKLAPQYGGTAKMDIVKGMWNCGMNTDEIPASVLKRYLYMDVYNTYKVRQGQKKRFATTEKWCTPMAEMNYDLNSVTIEMEHQGLAVDGDVAKEVKLDLERMQRDAERRLLSIIEANTPEGFDIDLGSKAQLAQLLYSRKIKETVKPTYVKNPETKTKELVDAGANYRKKWKEFFNRYKEMPKNKRSQKQFLEEVNRCFDVLPYGFNITPKFKHAGVVGFSVAAGVIEELYEDKSLSKKAQHFMETFIELGKCNTWIGLSYYSIAQNVSGDGMVHCSFNQTGTRSGRYSSSKPNMQQLPSAKKHGGQNKVRSMVVSRYGEDGVILTPDYSQLELRVAMEEAQDPNGLSDYKEGIDIHGGRAQWAYDDKHKEGAYLALPDKERASIRDTQKGVNFGILYGNFYTEPLQRAMYDAFFARYARMEKWHEEIRSEVVLKQHYTSPLTGFKYNFKGASMENYWKGYTDKGKGWRNRSKNLPVQGDAGRIVQVAMIGISKAIKEQGLKNTHFCGQVHDEVILDVHKKELDKAIKICHNEMSLKIVGRFEDYFGYKIKIPLDIDMEYGGSWYAVREEK